MRTRVALETVVERSAEGAEVRRIERWNLNWRMRRRWDCILMSLPTRIGCRFSNFVNRKKSSTCMMFWSTGRVLSLLFALSAAQNFSTWSPPGPGDVRSPCPGLNSLANHGFLPHSGKSITIPMVITAINDGMNVGADFATAIGGAGLLSVPANALATSFDLNNLDEHNFPIEHDASFKSGGLQ
jgi:Peroxidase, family 2